jgi:DNA-binding transcriptional regulator YiaG
MTPTELKAARKRLGLTQKALAQALTDLGRKTSPRTVEGWEYGRTIPWDLELAIEKLEKINHS